MIMTEFQLAVIEYLKHHTKQELAREFDMSLPSVDRWVNGKTFPHPAVQPHVFKFINEIRQKEGW